jgi:SWIB/MDM2 domain
MSVKTLSPAFHSTDFRLETNVTFSSFISLVWGRDNGKCFCLCSRNALTGQLSRPQSVKKLWEYIRANDLQDPSDKRQIRCDDAMRTVFKQDKVHMFQMTKILNHNLYNPDE